MLRLVLVGLEEAGSIEVGVAGNRLVEFMGVALNPGDADAVIIAEVGTGVIAASHVVYPI